MENKPRKAWVAGLLTFFTIGLGHLYCGNAKKAILLFFGQQVLYVIVFSLFLFYSPIGFIIAIVSSISYLIYCIADSVKGARIFSTSYYLNRYNKWYIYLLSWSIASFAINPIVEVTVDNNIAQVYKIPSGAMKPTLQIGDHIIADKFTYINSEPKRGDIVIFPFPEDPSKDFIMRIVGMGGETIEIKDKQILTNGDLYQEHYKVNNDSTVFPKYIQPRDNFGPVQIPEDSLFVMGDNRDYSHDSRFWGFVKKATVKGRAKSVYWSWDKDQFNVRWNRIGNNIE